MGARANGSLASAVRTALILGLAAGCTSLGLRGGDYRTFDTTTGEEIELEELVRRLAEADVVFLGEEHDNDTGHRLQLWTTQELYRARPNLVLSLEQFECDVQPVLDAYLAGEIDEQRFRTLARPWNNYTEHYRPVIEWARAHGVPVVAANVPRPLAARTARYGWASVAGRREAPWALWTEEPEYRARFTAAMEEHGSPGFDERDLERWFAAQVVKDERMAESITAALSRRPPPLVVHWCGKFHSDRRLGTVSRVLRRRPDVRVAVVTMSSDRPLRAPLDERERAAADFVWRVR